MTVREWVNQWNGRGIDEDGAYGNQCWDLAAKYAKELIGCPRLPTKPGGNGGARHVFEIFMAPLPQYFDRIVNDPNNPNQVPQPGDLIVWGAPMGTLVENGVSTAYGHIAVVLEAHPGESKFKVFEQTAAVGVASEVVRNYRYVLGWLAPKVRPAFDAAPAPAVEEPAWTAPAMPAGEHYLLAKEDTFWGLETAWGLPYGTLQSLNPSLDARRLPVGQHIRIRHPAVVETPADPNFYTIKADDTFWDLENRWGLAHGTLQAYNPELNPRALAIGQRIRLTPAPVATVSAPQEASLAPFVPEPNDQPATLAPVEIPDTPATTAPNLAIAGGEAAQPNWFQRNFSADKVLKDLSALGTFLSAAIIFVIDHHTLIAGLLTALGGVILGENRFRFRK